MVPLSAPRVEGVVDALRLYSFDRVHGAFMDRTIWKDGKGALLSGDIVQVVMDNKSVSFMWSFPNFIPLSAPRVGGRPREWSRPLCW
jgi:hypothetical protein